MGKISKTIIFLYLFIFIFISNSLAIESAAHKVEVSKCLGIIMTIKNNSSFEKINNKANKILELYLDKIIRLDIGSLMLKEMSEIGANSIYKELQNTNSKKLDKILDKCISTFRIG